MQMTIQRTTKPQLLKAIRENEAKGFECIGRYREYVKMRKMWDGNKYDGTDMQKYYYITMRRDEG